MTEFDAPNGPPPPPGEPPPGEPPPGLPPEEPPPAPPALRPYDLPSARGVVTYGLQLASRSSAELRRASLYIGLLTLALLGPPAVLAVEYLAHTDLTSAEIVNVLRYDPEAAGALLTVISAIYLGVVGWLAVSIDGQLIAVALLAAREGDRPFTLREATIRARQVFWRMIRGGFIVGLVSAIVQLILGAILGAVASGGSGADVIVTFLAVILIAPLGYLATGVVLGDVGAREALKRSIKLARARPRIALVVALFTLVTAAIQLFAFSAGLQLFTDVGSFLHLGPDGGPASLVVLILFVLAFVMAFGSLTFTIGAIVAAPQVAAFLGLTYYSAGLDRARELAPTAPRFRWVTRPMVVLIAVVGLVSGVGIANLH